MIDSKDIFEEEALNNDNIYLKLNSVQEVVNTLRKTSDPSDLVSIEEHCDMMISLINLMRKSLSNTEYCFSLEQINGQVTNIDNIAVSLSAITSDIYIFQPLDNEVTEIDMQSLSDTLSVMVKSGKIPGEVLILPPDINVIKAKFRPLK